jgi:phosphoenolpyruvate carboxykinase (GTP)
MLPFIGYHVGDYLQHWFDIGNSPNMSKLPRIYLVNWFRKNADGKFIWPGYGENSRVLKWIAERLEGIGKAVETPVGNLPAPDAIDISGLDLSAEEMSGILEVNKDAWRMELQSIRASYADYGAKLPKLLADELDKLEKKLG